jgi:transcriptional regulator GlxA family with amidase domain
MNMRMHTAQGPMSASHPTSSGRSVVPSPAQIASLVMQAMLLFESNREIAWSCLRHASTLLAQESNAIINNSPQSQSLLRPAGLAAWQAKLALEYIEQNLGSKMTTREIANHVGLSTGHFSRAFKRSVGFPPKAYLAVRRIERAKLMMTSTRERLALIAATCGFADQSHLCRRFRCAVGISPSLWRRISMHYSD